MKRFALADCNNFFVSCEKIFDPKLNGKSVVVLSSNDACVIARSNEAKKLGIKMGEPAFKCKDIFKKYNVLIYSSNFSLYGDISARVMQTLNEYSTDIEIYSVDEAFFFMPDYTSELTQNYQEDYYAHYAKFVRKKVKQKVGIPISIGIGPTKTLAKIANKIAKKRDDGVFDITNQPNFDDILKSIEVVDIWGIGYRYTKKLNNVGIKNAFDLKNADERWIKKNLTINGLRTMLELRGTSCIELQDEPEPRKSLTVSRLFGRNVTDLNELKEGLASYVSMAAEKLRKQKMITSNITVFLSFTRYHDPFRFYNSYNYQLPIATSYTPDLINAASFCLENMFKPGLIYKKVGIIFNEVFDEKFIQMNTNHKLPDLSKQSKIIKTFDKINSKMGKDKVLFAASGVKKNWQTKRLKKSPCYTTNWNEILTIRI